jgi:hypothetical protein
MAASAHIIVVRLRLTLLMLLSPLLGPLIKKSQDIAPRRLFKAQSAANEQLAHFAQVLQHQGPACAQRRIPVPPQSLEVLL